jgi:hypothetical protein
MKVKLILLALFALVAFPQGSVSRYAAIKETVLAAAAETITIQQPTGSSVSVLFEQADIYCSVACTITASWNGTAATSTTLTPKVISGSSGSALAFSSSNVGTGTQGKTFYLQAGATIALDISDFFLPRGAGGTSNFTLATNSITGTARIQIQWTERTQ